MPLPKAWKKAFKEYFDAHWDKPCTELWYKFCEHYKYIWYYRKEFHFFFHWWFLGHIRDRNLYNVPDVTHMYGHLLIMTFFNYHFCILHHYIWMCIFFYRWYLFKGLWWTVLKYVQWHRIHIGRNPLHIRENIIANDNHLFLIEFNIQHRLNKRKIDQFSNVCYQSHEDCW